MSATISCMASAWVPDAIFAVGEGVHNLVSSSFPGTVCPSFVGCFAAPGSGNLGAGYMAHLPSAPNYVATNVSGFFAFSNGVVEPMAACPTTGPNGLTAYVVMPVNEYTAMLTAGNVVAQVELFSVQVAVLGTLACLAFGLFFGWLIGGRGEGRSS